MKTKLLLVLLFAAIQGQLLLAQKTKPVSKATVAPKTEIKINAEQITMVEPVLLTIGNEKITKSDFLAVYNKNNSSKESKIDKKDLEEYLDLFINFRLKVQEAERLKLDTASSFISELEGYRKQLAQPFLVDKDVNENLLKEAFDRSQWDVRAAHVLVRVDQDALPKDTLAAWNKIMNARKRIVAGEDFGKVAADVSEDPSARDQVVAGRPPVKGNRGDLGYFTVFDMVYPFETAAFTTPVGEVSMPVRTSFGYHIVKVADKQPSMGRIQVAHLLLASKPDDTPEIIEKRNQLLKEIQQKIDKNVAFEDLVKEYSDDKGSAPKGGMLPWFGPNRMVPEFVSAIYGMKKNQVSKVVETIYGYHFIKLLDYKGIPSFDDSKNELKMKIARDIRSNKSKDAFVNRLKKEYNFTSDTKALDAIIATLDTSYLSGNWNVTKAQNLNRTLISFGGQSFNQADFVKFLDKNQGDGKSENVRALALSNFDKWVEERIMEFEDSRLAEKHKEFRDLMKEYRDGILLFELTDQMVWSKAVKDTIGLQEFYDDIKHNYQHPRRVDANIFKFKDEKIAKRNLKKVNSMLAKNISATDIANELNKKTTIVELESGLYAKGDNSVIDSFEWKTGLSDIVFSNGEYNIVYINKVYEMEPKSLNEIRGIVISEYQNYLEKEWIKLLRKTYSHQVDKEVFSSIF
jgi:peptidyl-prolyl cis-trans isomerase SurA